MANTPDNDAHKKESVIRRASRKLNSRRYKTPDTNTRTSYGEADTSRPSVGREWKQSGTAAEPGADERATAKAADNRSKKVDSFFHKLLIGSLVFFVGAVGVAGYLFYSGSLSVSGKNVRLALSGENSITAGKELSLDVVVANNNDVALQDARIIITYPEGARDADDPSMEKGREEIDLGEVVPGEQTRSNVRARLFGSANATSAVLFQIEYGLANSNATLVKEAKHTVMFNESPVSVAIDGPDEVNANQQNMYEITIASNVNVPMDNVSLRVAYPSQFRFQSASPNPDEGDAVWDLGTLNPEEEKQILLTGLLNAQTSEERTLTFTTGRHRPNAPGNFETVFDESKRTFIVREPYIDLEARVNSTQPEDAVVQFGSKVGLAINWKNNLSGRISNLQINALVAESPVEYALLEADNGFYQSNERRLVWNPTTISELSSVSGGANAIHTATIPTISFEEAMNRRLQNPVINLKLQAAGQQTVQADAPRTVSANKQYTLKFGTRLSAKGETRYVAGPFTNSGPVPPRANQTTTYTIRLGVSNSVNDVRDAKLEASLPSAVAWTGETNSDAVTYDASRRTVVWDIDSVRALSGYGRAPKTVQFQVEVTPSSSQVGNVVPLLRDTHIQGIDEFTGQEIKRVIDQAPTTQLQENDRYGRYNGEVQAN